MIRFISLPAALVGLLLASTWDLGFVETFVAVCLIIAFAIAAAGWTIRHDV